MGGNLQEVVYEFRPLQQHLAGHVVGKHSKDLWHSRPGYPSDQSLKFLQFVSINSNKHVDCSGCF